MFLGAHGTFGIQRHLLYLFSLPVAPVSLAHLPVPLSPSFFWTRNARPPDGVTSEHHSTAMGKTVIVVSIMTEQRKQLVACCLSNKLPNCALWYNSAPGPRPPVFSPPSVLTPRPAVSGSLSSAPGDGGVSHPGLRTLREALAPAPLLVVPPLPISGQNCPDAMVMLKGCLCLGNSLPPPGDPLREAVANLHDHRLHHNSADELRRRDFHGIKHSLNSRDLSLHHHRQIGNFVDVIDLRNLGMFGHLVDRLSVRVYAPGCAP